MLNESIVLAQSGGGASPAGGAGGLMGMVPFIVIFVAMIYLMFRSQKKQARQRQQMLDAVRTGDRIMIAGGIYGFVTNVKDASLMVKIADNVSIEVAKSGVSSILEKAAGEDDSKSDKK